MTATGRGYLRLQHVMRALCWASVAGVLCLWLATSTSTYDGAASFQSSVAAQAPAAIVLPVRQHVDLAMVLPEPAWFPLLGLLPAAALMPSVAAIARRPLRRPAPRAPPVASAM